MPRHSKSIALGLGLLVTAGALALAQDVRRAPRPARGGAAAEDGSLVLPGSLVWLVRSDVAAKREGVLASIPVDDGIVLKAGQEIGHLDDELARLTYEKQKVIAESVGAILKAQAQKEQASASLARLLRLRAQNPGFASQDDVDKATADLNFADALLTEAKEKRKTDVKDLELAQKALEQHRIVAPYNGVVIKRLKNPGESVQPNEAVVRLGNTDKFKFVGWMALEHKEMIRPGDPVEFRPDVEGVDLPIETKVFHGKIISLGSEVPEVGNVDLSITAEIDNPFDPEHPELSLLHGLRGSLTIRTGRQPAGVANRAAPAPATLDPAVSSASRSR